MRPAGGQGGSPYPLPLYLTSRGGCPGQVACIRADVTVEVLEPGPDLVGERVRQPVQDRHGSAPGLLRRDQIALGRVGLAQRGQRLTLVEAVADLAVGRHRLPVLLPGPGVVAEMTVDEAQAIQRVTRAAAVAGFAVQAQRALAMGQRLVELAQ